MSDADLIEWLNYWLVAFRWVPSTERCLLTFQDPYEHRYDITGKDLRECVANAVAKHPTSLTFIKGETR